MDHLQMIYRFESMFSIEFYWFTTGYSIWVYTGWVFHKSDPASTGLVFSRALSSMYRKDPKRCHQTASVNLEIHPQKMPTNACRLHIFKGARKGWAWSDPAPRTFSNTPGISAPRLHRQILRSKNADPPSLGDLFQKLQVISYRALSWFLACDMRHMTGKEDGI